MFAALKTSNVSIFNLSKIILISFIRLILISLWVFSITFAASATLISETLYVPAFIILLYILSILLVMDDVEPEIIFIIFVKVLFLSPGLILSGL